MSNESLSVTVRRLIAASPEFLFDAWTTPEQLRQWWGPAGVACPEAEVDLSVGGEFRIANLFNDGRTIWIHGRFETIDRPHRIQYSWALGLDSTPTETVTVIFEPAEGGTLVTVHHQNAASAEMNEGHNAGWEGCLDGLVRFAADREPIS